MSSLRIAPMMFYDSPNTVAQNTVTPPQQIAGAAWIAADALGEAQMRQSAWLELRTDDVDGLVKTIIDAGIERVRYVATPTFYFVAPGGQVFGIVGNQRV